LIHGAPGSALREHVHPVEKQQPSEDPNEEAHDPAKQDPQYGPQNTKRFTAGAQGVNLLSVAKPDTAARRELTHYLTYWLSPSVGTSTAIRSTYRLVDWFGWPAVVGVIRMGSPPELPYGHP
jgi:hypothetical protein